MYGSRGRRQDLGGPLVSLPVLAENWQNWQTGRTPSRFVSTPPRPIHRRKALGETVTTVILHGGVLYYNLSYGGYTPKSQLAAINPLFLPVTMIYLPPCAHSVWAALTLDVTCTPTTCVDTRRLYAHFVATNFAHFFGIVRRRRSTVVCCLAWSVS